MQSHIGTALIREPPSAAAAAPPGRVCETSFAQERLQFLDRYEPGSALYNIPFAVEIEGVVDADIVERVFQFIVQRHEPLRTVFRKVGGALRQVVLPEMPVVLRRLGEVEPESMQRLLQEEAAAPFDLAEGPLLRVALAEGASGSHVLLLTMHHIVVDRWSAGILFREISVLYEAFRRGEQPCLPALTVRYSDYAQDERAWLDRGNRELLLRYWRTQIAGAPRLLELPTDRPRPAVPGHKGATRRFHLPLELTARARELGMSGRATLFMVLAAAFNILLHRYSGQDDICVGFPVAARRKVQWESLIGVFMNTVVLRTRFAPEETFATLLEKVGRQALDAYDHQYLPFDELVQAVSAERIAGYSPLFQVMMQKALGERLDVAGWKAAFLPTAAPVAKFDMLWSFIETPGLANSMAVEIEYNTDLFDAVTIERMVAHYQALLDSACVDPHTPVCRLRLLGEDEKRRITADWNATAVPFSADKPVHELLEAQAARTPEAIALVHSGKTMTYAELNASANRLGRRLAEYGLGAGSLAAIRIERSPALIIAVLAVLKTGAAYLPIDASYPDGRIEYMLADAQPRVFLVDGAFESKASEAFAGRTLRIENEQLQSSGYAVDDLTHRTNPDDPVYAIYTSGSTGKPKGAAVGHSGFTNLVTWYVRELALRDDDKVLLISSIGFDLTQKNIYAALLAGGQLHLASEGFDPHGLVETISRERITCINCTPSAFYSLIRHRDPASLSSLRHVVLGGEPINAAELSKWLARVPGDRPTIYNTYGPTECTDVVAFCRWRGEPLPGGIPIGRPIANTRLYILDRELTPVPAGVTGEICIAGVCVGLGYLNSPENSRFVSAPHLEEGGRLYRTGDLGRYLPDGQIEYLGRADNQVKLRGYRIELGEIEAAMQDDPAVADCCVVVREEQLVAYMTGRGGATVDGSELRRRLPARLPAYMLPDLFVQMDALPLTANGKVDRADLPAPGIAPTGAWLPPRTETEARLATIWAEVLKRDPVGVQDSFFQCGGHSLLAVEAVARIRELLGIDVTLREFLTAQTIANLAGAIDAKTYGPSIPVIRQQDTSQPLSATQRALWEWGNTSPEAGNIAMAISIAGMLDVSRLEAALHGVCRRHDALRTFFPVEGAGPVQRVAPAGNPMPLEVAEVSRTGDILRDANRIFAERIDITQPQLFRWKLYRRSEQDHVLLFCITHYVFDGWSMDLFLNETFADYARKTDVHKPVYQCAHYSAWLESVRASDRMKSVREYWQAKLTPAPALLTFDSEKPRPHEFAWATRSVFARLDRQCTGKLEALAAERRVFLFSVITAAIAKWTQARTGAREFLLTTVCADRELREFERTMGYLINHVLLRIALSPGETPEQTIDAIDREMLLAMEHRHIPRLELFGLLPPPPPGYGSRVQVFHTHLRRQWLTDVEAEPLKIAGFPLTYPVPASCEVKFYTDLVGGELAIMMLLNAGVFSQRTAETYVGDFVKHLKGIAECAAH